MTYPRLLVFSLLSCLISSHGAEDNIGDVTETTDLPFFVKLEYNETVVSEIHLMEGDHQMYTFTLTASLNDLATYLEIKTTRGDSLEHVQVFPQRVNITAGLVEGSIDKNPEGELVGHLNVSGILLGFTYLQFHLSDKDHTMIDVPLDSVMVKVSREKSRWERIFIGSVITLVSIAYINMACTLDLEAIKRTVKRPIAPGIGLMSQYLFMPLCSYALGYALLRDRPEMWLALFLTGCSPGGGGSNMWTFLLGGSLDLSITMTFVSTLASYAAFPLWVYALGRLIPLYSSRVGLPYRRISMLIVGLILPIGIGLLIRRFCPRAAEFLKKTLKPLALFFIIFVMVFGIFAYFYIFYFLTWQIVIVAICLPWFGFIVGAVLSICLRQSKKDVIAICIETGVQNTGLAIGVLQVALLEEAPLGDIGMLVPIMVATMTPIPLLAGYIVQACKGKKTGERIPLEDRDMSVVSSAS